jgi:hypothetical protein
VATSRTQIESPFDLIGLPYKLGGDTTDGIDCIHVVYWTLQYLKIPTPEFKSSWYAGRRVEIGRDLLRWGYRIEEPVYDGDVVLINASTIVFGVVWDRGILIVSDFTKKVEWHPVERLGTSLQHCFRSRKI